MTASTPRETLTEQIVTPVGNGFLRALCLAVYMLFLSACASSPPKNIPLVIVPEQPEQMPIEEPDPEPEQEPATTLPQARPLSPEPHRPCAWSQTRGIATLTGIAQKQGSAEGTWQFFPGDEVVFHPVPDEASKGDEYKALLRRPLSGDCEHPRLIIVSPV